MVTVRAWSDGIIDKRTISESPRRIWGGHSTSTTRGSTVAGGVGEMGVGETGVGETGVGATGVGASGVMTGSVADTWVGAGVMAAAVGVPGANDSVDTGLDAGATVAAGAAVAAAALVD